MMISLKQNAKARRWPLTVLVVLLILTTVVYWPALLGGYLFDDSIYIVDNMDVHVTSLDIGAWVRAALSQAGAPQFRALSMLSFATNYFLTGVDPFWFKATNLGIHLVNGLLLFFLLRELFRLRVDVAPNSHTELTPSAIDWSAACIAGIWLLLPINLTAVAYVSQRMEALANIFVFAGLFCYLCIRRHQYATNNQKPLAFGLCLLAFTALGLCAKESAVLLPLYTACIEFAVTSFRDKNGRTSRVIAWTHGALLVVPLILGSAWLLRWIFRSAASVRTFSIGERLLTEPRVLLDYISWTLLPDLKSLTFYHDDLAVSHGLFDPPTTAPAIGVLIILFLIAIVQHTRRPLFSLGILWFFAGHALTGTIIPLELVFEHRNYFPSVGLLLAVASIIALEPGLRYQWVKIALTIGFVVLCSFTTMLRAEEWSHPLRLAYSEALKRPDSRRAQYELARTLIIASGDNQQSPLIDNSIRILQQNAYKPDSGIAPLQALIFLAARAHRPIEPAWWKAITTKLQHDPPSQTDVGVLIFLFHCQISGDCPTQKQELLDAFGAALLSSDGDVNLKSAYADFAFIELNDARLAETMLRDVVAEKPQVVAYRVNLIRFLTTDQQFAAAQAALADLQSLNRMSSIDATIDALGVDLRRAESNAADSSNAKAKQQR